DGDIPALIGASAAVALTGAPFNGPIGAAKVGYINGEYVLNPTVSELKNSKLELVVAGTSNAVLMVESEAAELSEDVMLGAVMFGHREMQKVIAVINELVAEAGRPKWYWQPPAKNEGLVAALRNAVGESLAGAFQVRDKLERRDAISSLKNAVQAAMALEVESKAWNAGELYKEYREKEYQTMGISVLKTKVRIDCRALDQVCPINSQVSVLKRVHGSSLFT